MKERDFCVRLSCATYCTSDRLPHVGLFFIFGLRSMWVFDFTFVFTVAFLIVVSLGGNGDCCSSEYCT